MKVRNTLPILSMTLLVSCSSSYYRQPETIEAKMERFSPREVNVNPVPTLHAYVPKLNKRARIPASTKETSALSKYSNRRLYFLSLYSQYLDLVSYSSSDAHSELKICPGFHSSLVETNPSKFHRTERKVDEKWYSTVKTHLSSNDVLKTYPELSLPIVADADFPIVYDVIKDTTKEKAIKVVNTAIDLHITKTHRELLELCETGTSSNYYSYENFITSIEGPNSFRANQTNANSLFKTTLISNTVLLNSLEKTTKTRGRGIASTPKPNEFLYEALHRIQAPWVKGYIAK